MGTKQIQAAIMRRQTVKRHVLEHNGLTSDAIGQALNLSNTAIRGHLHALIAEGLVEYQKNPHSSFASGSLPGLFGAPGFTPTFSIYKGLSTKMRGVACKLADDFLGRRVAPAVQIGMKRDPLITALYGAGSAA